MSIPQWYAGQIITADRLNARHRQLVQQESSIEMQDEDSGVETEVVFDVEAGAIYEYELLISYSAVSDSSSDLDWWWDTPSGVSMSRNTRSYSNTPPTSSINAGHTIIQRRPATGTRIPAGGSDDSSPPGNFHSAYDTGTLIIGSTSGTVRLMVAQDGGSSNITILRGGSTNTRLLYSRIG